MSRYAKPNQTIADIQKMIEDNGGLKAIVDNDKLKVRKDLSKVDVGHDIVGFINWEIPTCEIVGTDDASFPVAWCYTQGLDELPVAFVLYIGQEGSLRAYIPLQGNNVRGHDTISNKDTGSSKLDFGKMRESVVNRILVKGEAATEKGGEAPLTFRQLIQSLRDFGDQYASVMPVAKDAENSFWGIENIWFENGVLMLGQHDDEGLSCDTIAERIEGCVPSDLLDGVAVVKIGVTYQSGGVNIDVLTKYDEPAKARTVQSSVVKPCRDNWFCKWTLKFA